ncbi:flagellar motor switch protein FliG [Palleronia sediminis]|uniref:Flagellar motor switch protein FliG n=1 Tax=Palleronia sediminis TaxID=2547833 RepID=A0A4R6A9K5_9RHOB|nr:FliG C-terminal domain-containing protein [Palleronia sediminis]TDL79575.1 flagellar motor switch protein FliG [Palleronia sediminis]
MQTDIALRPDRAPESLPVPATTPGLPATLSRRQKAAIVVRLLLAEGAKLPLDALPHALQAELTTQMAQMRFVDRATLRAVVEQFAAELDEVGIVFPDGIEGVLGLLDGAISPELAARMRRQSGAIWAEDPWDVLSALPPEKLEPLLLRESPEIGAVILSKLDVGKAATLLGKLPGDRARRLTLAVSETADIAPEAVRRIGVALAADLRAEPARAFPAAGVARLGAILNVSPGATREELLEGLRAEDAALADRVRAEIFTFADIATRVAATDVAALSKAIEPDDLITAIAAGEDDPGAASVAFLLDNMSKRLAESLRQEAEDRGPPTQAEIEAAQLSIVTRIRDRADAGEIVIQMPET